MPTVFPEVTPAESYIGEAAPIMEFWRQRADWCANLKAASSIQIATNKARGAIATIATKASFAVRNGERQARSAVSIPACVFHHETALMSVLNLNMEQRAGAP